eukprot:818087-Prymnesium_polylepis.1
MMQSNSRTQCTCTECANSTSGFAARPPTSSSSAESLRHQRAPPTVDQHIGRTGSYERAECLERRPI